MSFSHPRRTHSGESRSSCSDYGSGPRRTGVGGDRRPGQGGRRPRARRNPKGPAVPPVSREGTAAAAACLSRQALCREGLSPEHDWTRHQFLPRHQQHQQCLSVEPLVAMAAGGMGHAPGLALPGRIGAGSGNPPDSGYEGTESDNPSVRHGDQHSQGGSSSDLDTDPSGAGDEIGGVGEGGSGSSPSSSSSSSPPQPSLTPSSTTPLRNSPSPAMACRHDEESPGLRSTSSGRQDATGWRCDVTPVEAAVVVVHRTTGESGEGEEEEMEGAEHEALLNGSVDAAEEQDSERQAFVTA